ncbi:orotidine-5'-phosphate decarboxylase [Alicyclobacillus tolerans]|uniref:orotidine-5'-phosphate decarboxylase n=1 Tax=Alicyclobacillus tolerans TaxID=90970 RepID=UPI001F02A58B|nr:orotidine-5'-phosphate decarboxylase [Alicyclobacillus tolerans]MCF8564439.1 orotidine-5'-phosphate decarboxylase [Alicyclobacillus tolerans]
MSSTLLEELLHPRFDLARARSYLALDVPSWSDAQSLVDAFGEAVDGYKVGLELYFGDGEKVLAELEKRNKRVFLDVKLHDIPNTVAGALRSIARHRVEMVNVHAAGGQRMLEAARDAVQNAPEPPLLIAVTVLTSLSGQDLLQMGLDIAPERFVVNLVELVRRCGLDGVVASGAELEAICRVAPEPFEVVVPGTRPKGADKNDQVRSITPGEAIAKGASRLVLGRAVTHAADKLSALKQIWEEMTFA